jgi:5-hydroxyisourate hydrolase
MGYLTTHVLDIARGAPAAGLRVQLYFLDPAWRVVADVTTNNDGRTDNPLLANGALVAGQYELHFHAGDYHRAVAGTLPAGVFLEVVPIRFTVADASLHYHVPLLLSPYGYSTYRGS